MAAKITVKKNPPVLKNMAFVLDELLESEKTYRAIFDHSRIATIVIDEDGTISLVNSTFEELSGYNRAETEHKKPWRSFVRPEDINRLALYFRECLKAEGWSMAPISFRFLDRKGTALDVSISVNVIPGTQNLVASFVDITPRKKFEKMLRSNEERYRSLVKTITTGVFRITWKQPSRFIWANPAFLEMTGYGSLSDLLKHTAASLFTDPGDYDCLFDDLLAHGFVRYGTIQLRMPGGTVLSVSLTAEVKTDDAGTIEWVDCTVENITDRLQAEQDLRSAQSRYEELLDAVTTYSVIGTDPRGCLTVFNTGSEAMLGYAAEELLGRSTPLVFLREEEVEARARSLNEDPGSPVTGFDAFVARARSQGCDEREWTYVRKDGTTIPVDLTLTVMRNEEGEITGYLGVAQEISEKKRLEEAFRCDKLQMSGVIYHIPDPTFAIDCDGRVIAWNRSIEELSGVKAVDILGKGNYEYSVPFFAERRPMLVDLIFASDQEIEEQGYEGLHRAANSISAENRSLKKEGKDLVIRGIASPIYDECGEIAGAIESITDITDVKEKESALLVSEAWFRGILEHVGSATMIADEDTTILYVNPAFEKLMGFTKEEMERKRKWTEFIFPEDLAMVLEYYRKHGGREEKIPPTCEFRFIRWDGQVRNGYVTVTGIPGTKRNVNSILDITEKKLSEEAVQRANKKLNYFSSVTRHDILNHLTVLKGNLELSQEQVRDPELLKAIEKELAAANAIQAQIMFTQDYQDIGISPPAWQDLRRTIINGCKSARTQGITISVDIEGVEIYADRLLQKVFYHLIENAIRYGGNVRNIRFSSKESYEELVLVCEDDGIGIHPEAKGKIFNRQDFGSAGLDMYLSREILSITGISISETGSYGKGARFEIRIPRGAYRFAGSA